MYNNYSYIIYSYIIYILYILPQFSLFTTKRISNNPDYNTGQQKWHVPIECNVSFRSVFLR